MGMDTLLVVAFMVAILGPTLVDAVVALWGSWRE